jgi:chaperone LolA
MLSVVCFAAAFAQEDAAIMNVLANVQKKYSGMASATAAFEQTVTLRFGKSVQRQSGVVKIQRGNKFRIETDEQILVANGSIAWIVSPANNQVLIDSFKENTRMFSPDAFLFGLPVDYVPTGMTEEQGLIKITLVPKSGSSRTHLVRSLTAWVRRNGWIVERISYMDRNHALFDITLTNLLFNAPVKESEFEFVPPAGMTVVDLRTIK